MRTVTVTEAKARIAGLLKLVAKGETVVIVSRGKAVAELRPPPREEPATHVREEAPKDEWDARIQELVRQGKLIPPKKKPDWSWLKEARARGPKNAGILDALLQEREAGR